MNLKQAQNRAKNLSRENIANDTLIFLEGLSERFIEWTKDRLDSSENIYGKSPLGSYSQTTESYWSKVDKPKTGKEKKAGSPYDLQWDGSLFESIYTKIDNSGAAGILMSSHEKDAGLPKWEGLLANIYYSSGVDAENSLFGFTDDEIAQIRELIKPFIIEYFRNALTG